MAKGRPKSGPRRRKVRVAFRANRQRPARDRSWTSQYHEHQFAEDQTALGESVRAKGDLSRKRTVTESTDQAGAFHLGVVVAMRGLIADVDDGREVWPCTIRRILRTRQIETRQAVTVGDRVRFRKLSVPADDQREGVVERIEPRQSELIRMTGERVHVIAANVDVALVVTSARQPNIKPHLIDRYLVAAHAGGVVPVICLNKIDLDDDGSARAIFQRYTDLGYQTLLTSALTGEGTDALPAVLRDKVTVVAGQSGVGKSSLLNVIQPGLRLRVRDVSSLSEKGRHTTSTAEMLRLDFGGYVVDTPGIRSFDLANIPPGEIEAYFVEFVPRVAGCRFPNCTHRHEAGCAILAAVEAGEIHPDRYESYAKLFRGD